MKPEEFKFILLGVIIGTIIYFFFVIQDDTPDTIVIQNFTKKFPTVQEVEWAHITSHEWEAEFKMESSSYSANFLDDGMWKHTDHEIKENEIPFNVKSALETEYHGYNIEAAEISETEEGIVYELAIEKEKEEVKLSMDANGSVIKKEVKNQ